MGDAVSSHTFPDMAKNGVLTVVVDSPQWIHHLSFFKDDMAGKLSRYGINEVRFRIGKVPEPEEKRAEALERQLSSDDRRYIENTLKGVRDDELRKRLKRLIVNALTKGRRK